MVPPCAAVVWAELREVHKKTAIAMTSAPPDSAFINLIIHPIRPVILTRSIGNRCFLNNSYNNTRWPVNLPESLPKIFSRSNSGGLVQRRRSIIRRDFGPGNLLDGENHRVWLKRENLRFLGFEVHQDAVFADNIFPDGPVQMQLIDDPGAPRPGVGFRIVKGQIIFQG